MSKFVTTTLLAFASLAFLAGDAEAGGRRRCSQTYAAAPVVAAPATAQATGQGYRTFSYQPATSSFQTDRPRKLNAWEYQKTDPRRYNGGN